MFSASDFTEQGDEALIATFFTKARLNKARTRDEGREIYEDCPYIQIQVKGDNKSTVVRKATDADKRRFRRQWQAYEDGCEVAVEGSPLEQWAYLSPARVMNLKALGFRTVEDIAQASDAAIDNIGTGARDLHNRAKEMIEGPDETVKKLRSEVRDLKRELKNVTAQLEAAIAPEDVAA